MRHEKQSPAKATKAQQDKERQRRQADETLKKRGVTSCVYSQ